MRRFATIDVGTNSVLLLVAESAPSGRPVPLLELAEITRLGRGVDRSNTLSEEGMQETTAAIARFVEKARGFAVEGVAVAATSAARDAKNGAEFLSRVKRQTGIDVQVLSGDEEASLSFEAAWNEFGGPGLGLVVIDIGGGSTELIYGRGHAGGHEVRFRQSYDVGSVRLTERFVSSHPIPSLERERVRAFVQGAFSKLPRADKSTQVIGLAGTVTTLFAMQNAIDPYDAARVQGGILKLTEVTRLAAHLADLSVEERIRIPGLQPKRADVIPVGAMILELALRQLGASQCLVSDRGLRWGLLERVLRSGAQNKPMLK